MMIKLKTYHTINKCKLKLNQMLKYQLSESIFWNLKKEKS